MGGLIITVASLVLASLFLLGWMLQASRGPHCPACWHGRGRVVQDVMWNGHLYRCRKCGREWTTWEG